ncbi:MAG: GNAT family N-acetyltransferase [Flavobacteriales bacterium]|nr:GNAT family N-acetyltransferase [Flavobacteriales bacterium]
MKIVSRDFNSFFKAPFEIRGKKTFYASPFKPDLKKMLSLENPIFSSEKDYNYYTALKNGKIVGRISAHVHRAYNERFQTKSCYYGFFECVNDQEVANALLNKVVEFAKAGNFDEISGNFNLTAMQEMGVMVGGFENDPYVLQSYGMPYYPELLEGFGLVGEYPMSTFDVNLEKLEVESLIREKQKALFNDPDYEFVPVTKKAYKEFMPILLDIFNESFDQNDYFVPISVQEFDFQAQDLIHFIDSTISFVVLHKGKPVGTSLHIPDLNPMLRGTGSRLNWKMIYYLIKFKLVRERALLIFSAIKPEYQNVGMLRAILYKASKAMKERGYKTLGITWVSEKNIGSLRNVEALNGKKLHDVRIFSKKIA